MTIIKMVQLTPHTWQIRSATGHVIQHLVIAHSVYEASEYVKKYISSFPNWDYELIITEAKVITD